MSMHLQEGIICINHGRQRLTHSSQLGKYNPSRVYVFNRISTKGWEHRMWRRHGMEAASFGAHINQWCRSRQTCR